MFNARQLPEMPSKNRYWRHSEISEARFRHLLRPFAMDLTTTDVAQLCDLSVRSVNALYQRMRAAWLGSAPLSLLSQASLRLMISLSAPSVSGASEVAMGWLIWVWTSTFGSITAATNSSRAADTSTASSLFGHAKHRLAQFHGVRRDKFALHLKEPELRFNHRHLDLYKTLLKLLRDEPL